MCILSVNLFTYTNYSFLFYNISTQCIMQIYVSNFIFLQLLYLKEIQKYSLNFYRFKIFGTIFYRNLGPIEK